MNSLVFDGEYIEDLQRNGLRIIQPREGYRFSADSVILAHFAGEASLQGTVVDLGTGSGVILLLLSALCPNLKLVGLELQEAVADRARRSLALNRSILHDRPLPVEIFQGDLRQVTRYIRPCTVDAVVTNPPYVRSDAGPPNKNLEVALSKQELACNLEEVFRAAGKILKNRGRLFMVHKPARVADLCYFGRKHHLEPKRLRLVQPRSGESPNMLLVECVKNSAPGVIFLPSLLLADHQGNPSEEIKHMYGTEV